MHAFRRLSQNPSRSHVRAGLGKLIGFTLPHAPVWRMQTTAPVTAPFSTSTTIPTLSIPFNLTDLSLSQFDEAAQQQFSDSIRANLPGTARVSVSLTNIRAGSVLFDTWVLFLDGNSSLANSLATAASQAIAVRRQSCNLCTYRYMYLHILMRVQMRMCMHHDNQSPPPPPPPSPLRVIFLWA